MNPEDIKDEATLKAWLDGQTREVAITIAHRAAMRVAPAFWRRVPPVSRDLDLTSTLTSRALMIAGIAGTSPAPAISAIPAAAAAARAARVAARAAASFAAASASAARAAATSVSSATSESAASAAAYATASFDEATAAAAIWEVLRQDAATLIGKANGKAALEKPLWHKNKNPLADKWQLVRTAWADAAWTDPGWNFWTQWYDAAVEGRPLLGDWGRHWSLLPDIALIDLEIWDKGPDAVNPKVAEIFSDHFARIGGKPKITRRIDRGLEAQVAQLEAITEYGEFIVPNPETGLLRSEPKSQLDDYHRDDVLDRLEDALANIDLAGGQNFAYAIILRDLDRLKRVLKVRRDRPVRIFQVTLEVAHLIERRADNGECPAIANDPDLTTLIRELYGAAATLQAHDPVVKRFNNPVLHERISEITDEQARSLGMDLARISPVSEGLLKDEATEDAKHLARGESDPEIRRNLLIRSISRVVRVFGIAVRSNTVQSINMAAAILTLEPAFMPTIKWLLAFLL